VLEKSSSLLAEERRGTHLAQTRVDARTRWIAEGAASREKRYVNVASGDSECQELDELLAHLNEKGFQASKVPGPLLLATMGGKRPVRKLMPLSTSTAFAPTKELLVNAWKELSGSDHELDLAPGQEPKWSTHSLHGHEGPLTRHAARAAGSVSIRGACNESRGDTHMGCRRRVNGTV